MSAPATSPSATTSAKPWSPTWEPSPERRPADVSQAAQDATTHVAKKEMMETYLADEQEALDGFEFLTMAEAAELGHWEIVQKIGETLSDATCTRRSRRSRTASSCGPTGRSRLRSPRAATCRS